MFGTSCLSVIRDVEPVEEFYFVDLFSSHSHPLFSCLTTASLRRSFRLRKDRHASPGEPQTPDPTQTDFLIYEEVTQYLPSPGDRPRLIVLIGMFTVVALMKLWSVFPRETTVASRIRCFSVSMWSCPTISSSHGHRFFGSSDQWAQTEGDCRESSTLWTCCAPWVSRSSFCLWLQFFDFQLSIWLLCRARSAINKYIIQ